MKIHTRFCLLALSAAVAATGGDFIVNVQSPGGELVSPRFRIDHIVHGSEWKSCGRTKTNVERFTPLPADGRIAFETKVDDGFALAGDMFSSVTNGVLHAKYHTVVKSGGKVETISAQGHLPVGDYEGGSIIADTKRLKIPAAGENHGVACGSIRALRVESAIGDKFFDFAFDTPVTASVLRKSGETDLTLRFSAVTHAQLKEGDEQLISFALRTHETIVNPAVPWTAQAGDGFVVLAGKSDILPGSALDFTHIVPRKPCGTYGRLRTKGGHFEFEGLPGVRQKFFGMNLHSHACYHTLEDARRLTSLFVRFGYNSVRLHNYENEFQGLTKGSPDEATPVEERFEDLDNLFEACREQGLYVTVDLHIGRSVSYKALGIDKPGMVPRKEMKYLYLTNRKARDNFKTFVRGFFEHVNPHTRRRYADEPTLMFVSVVNESPCSWSCGEADGRGLDLCALEYDMQREMRDFIRNEIKSDVPLTTCNGGGMPFCLQPMRDEFCDYVDDHFYYDHPRWPETAKYMREGDRVPMFTANVRQLAENREIPAQKLFSRMWGKPYVITEFNWCAPSVYRASAGLLFGSLGAAQDWDGFWRYLWAHDHARSLETGRHIVSKLESASDALAMAADRAAMCLFLRGDLPPLERKASLVIKRSELDVRKSHTPVWGYSLTWPWAGWYAQLGTAMDKGPEGSVKDFAFPDDVKLEKSAVEEALGTRNLQPADGAVTIERERNAFTVTTERTCGGSVESGAFSAGVLTVNAGNRITSLWVSALDEEPLKTSRRILLTHLTQLYNTGDKFADRDGRLLISSGRTPGLMPCARALVRLALAEPQALRVYALDTDGSRRGEVKTRVQGSELVFTCDTARDRSQATYLYEIIRQ